MSWKSKSKVGSDATLRIKDDASNQFELILGNQVLEIASSDQSDEMLNFDR